MGGARSGRGGNLGAGRQSARGGREARRQRSRGAEMSESSTSLHPTAKGMRTTMLHSERTLAQANEPMSDPPLATSSGWSPVHFEATRAHRPTTGPYPGLRMGAAVPPRAAASPEPAPLQAAAREAPGGGRAVVVALRE